MHWNYLILSEAVGDHTEYFVAEVHYNAVDEPHSWSDREFNTLAGWDDVDNLRGTIEQLQAALRKPVLRVVGTKLIET